MRLHLLSDLHLEFAAHVPERVESDVLVLAGDIGPGLAGMRWAAEHAQGRPVLYVPGNHEFYRGNHTQARAVLKAAGDALGIHVLDQTVLELAGVRFLGCTLWTDFGALGEELRPSLMDAAGHALNDYEHIKHPNGDRFTPLDTLALHAKDRVWLEQALSIPHAGTTVVITHHAPVRASLPHWPQRPPVAVASSVNRLEDLLERHRIHTWLHGHVHNAVDVRVRNTRVVCNARGYPHRPGVGFRPGLVVEV